MTAERLVLTHAAALDLAPLYVIGALPRGEEAAGRDHLATCPESHTEFALLGSVVPVLLEDVPLVEPPAGLKARVLAAAAADLEARRGAGFAAESDRGRVVPFPTPDERARRTERPSWLARANDWAFRAAAVIALVALAVWNVLLQRDLTAEQGYRSAVTQVIETAGLPGSALAVIHGEGEMAPRGLAAVAGDGHVVFAMRDLAATQGSEVYTAWAIAGGGAPVPVGDFTVGADGTGSLTTAAAVAAPGATLALTREPRAGAKTPTLPIVAAGVVTPAG